jgi:hypothetical protein
MLLSLCSILQTRTYCRLSLLLSDICALFSMRYTDPLASVATRFLFLLSQLLFLAVVCLLFFGCHIPGSRTFPKSSLAGFIFFKHWEPQGCLPLYEPVELHFLHAFTSNSPSDMPRSMYYFLRVQTF